MTIKLLITACLSLSAVSATFATGNRVDSLIQAYADRAYYAGLLDLPTKSFLFATSGMDTHSVNDFTKYVLSQINRNPRKAVLYSGQLQEFLFAYDQKAMGEINSDQYIYGRERLNSLNLTNEEIDRDGLVRPAGYIPGADHDSGIGSGPVWAAVGGLLTGFLSFLSVICTALVITGLTFYELARQRGTRFDLTLQREELTTHFSSEPADK